MRKLASIQRIDKVTRHYNADTLDIVNVLGWQCITKIGDFKEGDACLYVEIDSLLPESNPVFSGISYLKESHYRVRTKKLRGVISSGLCLPINLFPEITSDPLYHNLIGFDATEILGITKWEPKEESPDFWKSLLFKGEFPSFIPKTDEPRLQSFPGVLDEIKDMPLVVTLKYDGTSFTAFIKNGEVGFCTRNKELKFLEEVEGSHFTGEEGMAAKKKSKTPYQIIFEKYDLGNKLKEMSACLSCDLAIQGELCGPGIQGNRVGLKELDLFVFDIFDITNQNYFDFYGMRSFCKVAGLNMVEPLLPTESPKNIEDFVLLSNRVYHGSDKLVEGIVIRPVIGCWSEYLKRRLSFKVINPEYLIKYGI